MLERQIENIVDKLFHTKSGFPKTLFKDKGYTLFNDFYMMFDEEIWPQLQYLAQKSRDHDIFIVDISRNLRGLKKKKAKVMSIPISLSSSEYINVLDQQGFIVESEKIIWFSQTASWGIWAERAWDICALNSRFNLKDFYNWSPLNDSILELTQDQKVRGKRDINIKELKLNYK